MDNQSSPVHETPSIERAEVDTTRPFRSVREAIAVFGERLLVVDVRAPRTTAVTKHGTSPKPLPPSFSSNQRKQSKEDEGEHVLADSLKRLEAELEATKKELKLLKNRESETEIALASLNAELHKNMSRMAEAEAEEAGKAAARCSSVVGANEGGERKRNSGVTKFENNSSPAQTLSLGENEGYGYIELTKKERKALKKKPIIPLIGDILWKKKSSVSHFNSLHGRSNTYL